MREGELPRPMSVLLSPSAGGRGGARSSTTSSNEAGFLTEGTQNASIYLAQHRETRELIFSLERRLARIEEQGAAAHSILHKSGVALLRTYYRELLNSSSGSSMFDPAPS